MKVNLISFQDKAVKELLSTLWMKAGAIGKCPVVDASVPDMLILSDNKMAVLTDENQFCEFAERARLHPQGGEQLCELHTE